MISLTSLLDERARGGGQALVEVDSGRRLGWDELQVLSGRRALDLEAAGVGPGDRVGLRLPRGAEALSWLAGVWRREAVAVPLDLDSPPSELQGLACHAELKALVTRQTDPDELPVGPGLLEASGGSLLRACPGELAPSPAGEALLLYTSGSTGNAKAVRHTHGSILASLRGLRERVFPGASPRILGILPWTHSHGLFTHALSGLVHGGACIVAPPLDLFSARSLWEVAGREGADFFSAVPAHYRLLLRASELPPPPGLTLACASAPLEARLAGAIWERWGIRVGNFFGMTETAGWCLYSGPGAPPGSVGRPGSCEIRVEEGELWLSGPALSPGYWRNDEEDRRSRRGRWFRTGDRVSVDEGGWVHYLGRLKRVLQVGGLSVQPEDIEAALRGLPGVQDCAVVGVADPLYGELPRAFVVPHPGHELSPRHLLAELRVRLAPARCPRWIVVLPRLPVTRSGKPDLGALEAWPEGGEADRASKASEAAL